MRPNIPDEGREQPLPRILQLTHEAEADIRSHIREVVARRFGRTVHDKGDSRG